MIRALALIVCLGLAAAPLAACGKKGDPEGDPPWQKKVMPKPEPPPGDPPKPQ